LKASAYIGVAPYWREYNPRKKGLEKRVGFKTGTNKLGGNRFSFWEKERFGRRSKEFVKAKY